MPGAADVERVRAALAGTRFADVRWVAETGSTNRDVLALARAGAPEGVVLVADHQSAGRGRLGRTWTAPPRASLLLTVLLRPPAARAPLTTMAMAVAAAEAVEAVVGVAPRLKWPNDLVWPGDGSAPDRKLAGILAEVDRPGSDDVAVAVGIGLNVAWPEPLPPEAAGLPAIAVTAAEIAGHPVDRADVLLALLRSLERWCAPLLDGDGDGDGDGAGAGAGALWSAWRRRSATLGRRVRVELGASTPDVEGTAVDVTPEGHLVVETADGGHRTFAVGDVVHLRPAPPG